MVEVLQKVLDTLKSFSLTLSNKRENFKNEKINN